MSIFKASLAKQIREKIEKGDFDVDGKLDKARLVSFLKMVELE